MSLQQPTMNSTPLTSNRGLLLPLATLVLCVITFAAIANTASLGELAKRARTDAGAPAIGLMVASGSGKPEIAVDGLRVIDGTANVSANDLWHVGSVTKSMTATLIGRLVDQGKLKFDSTLGELLPNIDMRPEYKAVTVRQVLQHRGGIVALTRPSPEATKIAAETKGTQRDKNAAVIAWMLAQPPVEAPGTKMVYSNGGYALLGHLAERLANSDYRDLMQREVFQPLGITTAAFGWPTEFGAEQPRGHGPGPNGLEPAPAAYRLPPHLDPAGNVCMSLAELTRYLQAHLAGMNGKDGALKAATIRELHTPPAAADGAMAYAAGWSVQPIAQIGTRHGHNGSAGTFYAEVAIVPERNLVAAVVTNAAPKRSEGPPTGPPSQAKTLREMIGAYDFSDKRTAAQ
jgi:CubicO group peptidase (beta-lactamase class C family)